MLNVKKAHKIFKKSLIFNLICSKIFSSYSNFLCDLCVKISAIIRKNPCNLWENFTTKVTKEYHMHNKV